MIHRELYIGRWKVDFFFCVDGYERTTVMDSLLMAGAPYEVMIEADELMRRCSEDCGFTFSRQNDYRFINGGMHKAVILIGPASSGAEFIDTFVHELHHLAVAIAGELGVDLEGETPAYLAGDSARALADVVCRLGCDASRNA